MAPLNKLAAIRVFIIECYKFGEMRYLYRITVVVLLAGLIGALLFRNYKTAEIIRSNAKQVIDSIPVMVVTAEYTMHPSVMILAGKVEAHSEIVVVSKVSGTIEKLSVKIGSSVKMNDEIARINDFYARQEYDMARKAYDQLKKEYDRYQDLAEVEAVTGQQLEKLKLQLQGAETKKESLEKRLDDFIIRAPEAGTVNQLFVTEGGTLGQGMPVCELIGSSGVQITSKLSIDEVENVEVGNRATVTTNFGHGSSYPVNLSEVGVKQGRLGGVPVRFSFENDTIHPPIGSYCRIRLEGRPEEGILIPVQSLVNYHDENGIFIVSDSGRALFTKVAYDYYNGEYIIIKDSLLADRKIITEGAFLLEQNERVKIIRRKEES